MPVLFKRENLLRMHRMSNIIGIYLLTVGALSQASVATREKVDLTSYALRYGYLMADHWMARDVSQQVERALLYPGQGQKETPTSGRWRRFWSQHRPP